MKFLRGRTSSTTCQWPYETNATALAKKTNMMSTSKQTMTIISATKRTMKTCKATEKTNPTTTTETSTNPTTHRKQ